MSAGEWVGVAFTLIMSGAAIALTIRTEVMTRRTEKLLARTRQRDEEALRRLANRGSQQTTAHQDSWPSARGGEA